MSFGTPGARELVMVVRCLPLEVGDATVAVLTFELPNAAPSLTDAERAVLRAIFTGASNDGIARARKTSPRTVANQIASIFRKHGVTSRAELVAHYVASVPQ